MSVINVFLLIAACILVAGFIGSFVGWFEERGTKDASLSAPQAWIYYFLRSTAAAITVPLFLGVIQSQIAMNVFAVGNPIKLQDWFIFFGLCVLAAIFSKKYLQTLYEKVLDRLSKTETKVEDNKGRLDEIEENRPTNHLRYDALLDSLSSDSVKDVVLSSAGDEDESRHKYRMFIDSLSSEPARSAILEHSKFAPTPPPDLSVAERKVWAALTNPAYPLGRRSFGGIMSETKLDRAAVTSILDKFKADNLVEEVRGERTNNVFYRWLGGTRGS